MIGIYKITSPTSRVYIGSSNDINNRLCSYKNLKCKSQTRLFNSIKAHGWHMHKFEVLEECSIEKLLERELYYGIKFNVLDKEAGLNCRLPKAGEYYTYMAQETKDKIGKANKSIRTRKSVAYYESRLKKLTIAEVKEAKILLINNELTHTEISKLFNVTRKIISNISCGKTYKSLYSELDTSRRKKKYIKLEKQDYDIIKDLYSKGVSQSKIAKQFNVDGSHISRIVNNQTYIKSLTNLKQGDIFHSYEKI
jgi:group I intron endonuclease